MTICDMCATSERTAPVKNLLLKAVNPVVCFEESDPYAIRIEGQLCAPCAKKFKAAAIALADQYHMKAK